jgi:hypothetical protein
LANSNHVAGEILEPEKNLPGRFFLGVAAVVLVYMLANVAYLHALGVSGWPSRPRPPPTP